MSDFEIPSTEIEIQQQGAPIINDAWVVYKNEHVILIEMDMRSKYCSVNSSSGNGVFIGAEDHSLNLNPDVDREVDTWVYFPEAKGYSFFGHSSGRYTIQLTFFKRNV